jgi:hypothetical protein
VILNRSTSVERVITVRIVRVTYNAKVTDKRDVCSTSPNAGLDLYAAVQKLFVLSREPVESAGVTALSASDVEAEPTTC